MTEVNITSGLTGPTERAQNLIWSQEIPARNIHFTGRQTELALLRSRLQTTQVEVLNQPPQALYGLGGIGKSEIAAEYAHRNARYYEIVWWIRAEHEDRIRDALIKLGRRLKLPQIDMQRRDQSIWAVMDALHSKYRSWLLIFDNASDPSVVQRYLPKPAPQGHVIITSRETQWRKHTKAAGIEVVEFDLDDTIAFLRKRVTDLAPVEGDDERAQQEDHRRRESAARLATALGNLPIAAEHAAAYLNETRIGADAYLELFEDDAHALLTEDVDIDYPQIVATTWALSVEKLGADAAELFNLCAFFSPEPIAEELFLKGARHVTGPAHLRAVLSDVKRVRAAARRLHRYSLAKIDGKLNVITVHRVVQSVTRGRIKVEAPETIPQYRAAVHTLLAASDPLNPDRESNDVQYDRSLQHLVPAGAIETEDPALRHLIINQVRRLHLRGGHEESLRLGEEALRVWRSRLGDADADVLQLATEVGIALRLAGRSTEARVLNHKSLRLLREHYGPKNEVTLLCANSHGADLRALGQFTEALRHDLELLPLFEEVFLPDHERTLNVRNNIAADYRRLGDFAKALEHDERTHLDRERLFGATDLRTLASKDAMARDMRACGLYAQSLDVAREVIDIHNARLGRVNLDWLNAQKGFAVALRKAGYYDEALRESTEALERYRNYLGPDHRYTLRAAINLINDLRSLERLSEAEQLGRRTLAQCAEVDDPLSDITYAAMVNLAVVLRRRERPSEAEQLDESALAGLRDLFGPEHPFTLAASTNLASDLAALGKTVAARELGEQLLEISSGTRGETHPDTLAIAANLILDRRATGDESGADMLREKTIRLYGETLSEEHPEAQVMMAGGRINADIEPY